MQKTSYELSWYGWLSTTGNSVSFVIAEPPTCLLSKWKKKNTTFLSKATDYFSHMLLGRWEANIRRKEKLPEPGIELTTTRSWVQHAHHWATRTGWNNEYKKACDKVRAILKKKAVLLAPNFEQESKLAVDASDTDTMALERLYRSTGLIFL